MATATSTVDQPSFDYVRKLVFDHAAIELQAEKAYLVESRLLPIARQASLGSVSALVSKLRSEPFGSTHSAVVDAMTTNETSFFRDMHPFDVLREHVLPQLIERRAARKTLNLWSAASSSGQEIYTIAMLIREHFPMLAGWNVRLFATDINQQMVDRAASGLYSQLEVNRGLPVKLLLKYFQKVGLQWQIKDEVRKSIHFTRMNLAEKWPMLPTMDVVFMRNVLIYFGVETKRQILAKVRQQLAPDGSLFLGGAETTLGVDEAFERVNHGKTSTYRLGDKVRPAALSAKG
jgi:chemotaxis protein methyltransferase CheR